MKPDLSNEPYQATQGPTGLRVTGTPVKFVMVGALNTIVGLAMIYTAKWMGVDDAPANAMGYAVALCVSFALNKSWTFAYRGPAAPAFVKFLLVIAIAYLLNLATVLGAIRVFHINGYIAQAMGIAPYTLFTYFASRDFAFRLR